LRGIDAPSLYTRDNILSAEGESSKGTLQAPEKSKQSREKENKFCLENPEPGLNHTVPDPARRNKNGFSIYLATLYRQSGEWVIGIMLKHNKKPAIPQDPLHLADEVGM